MELDSLVDIAAWAAHHCQEAVLRSTITQISALGGAIQPDSDLFKRIQFFELHSKLGRLPCHDEQGLREILDNYDTFFDLYSEAEGVPKLHWVWHRVQIIRQMFMATLCGQLKVQNDATCTPDSIDTSDFSLRDFKKKTAGLQQHLRAYGDEALNAAEREFFDKAQSLIDNTLGKAVNARNIYFLLQEYSLSKFRRELNTFMHEVETAALGEVKNVQAAYSRFPRLPIADVVFERDWGDEDEETKGPYAGATTRRARRPSTPKRAATPKRAKQQTPPARPKRTRRALHVDESENDDDENEEQSNEQIQALRTSARNLQISSSKVPDPIEEAMASAGEVPQSRIITRGGARTRGQANAEAAASSVSEKPSMLDKKPSATEVPWTDTDQGSGTDSDEIEHSDDELSLSRAKSPRKFSPLRRASAPARKRLSSPSRYKRKRWSEEEEQMLINGVKEYGEGKWAEILEHYGFSAMRTNIDLKDKWRNLKKRGLV